MIPETRLPILLRGSWFGMNKAFRSRISKLGLTTSQYTILRCVKENLGLSQEQLAEKISTNKNNACSLVKRMINLGLLKKRLNQSDRRSFQLFLSKKGDKLFNSSLLEAEALRKEVISLANCGNEDEITRILNKCSAAIDRFR